MNFVIKPIILIVIEGLEMNVAMVVDCYYPRVNGVAVSVKTYSDELSRRGHKVLIVCPDYSEGKEKKTLSGCYYDYTVEDNPNVSVFRIASADVIWSKEDKLGRFGKWNDIKTTLDRFKPDIIHINTEFNLGYLGLNYARHRHVPSVFTFHTFWEEYFADYAKFVPNIIAKKAGKEFTKFYLKRVDEIIVPTKRIGAVVERYGIENGYDILPTGVSTDICNYRKRRVRAFFYQMHKLLPVIKKKTILLYVGRMAKEKNLYFLIDMLGEVRKTIKDAVLLFVGGGPEEDSLKAYAKTKPYSWNICFAGYRTRDELVNFYHFADLFVFPSCTETQGLVTIEAMMCGLPVVAIGEMGTLDIMQGDNGGFMVKNDIAEFSEKVCLLLQDADLYGRKKLEAVEWSRKWSVDTLTDSLLTYYGKAIKRHEEKK